MVVETIKQGISEADRLFKDSMRRSRLIEETGLLDDHQKQWLKVGSEIFSMDLPSNYLKEIEELMDALIYLNGCAGDSGKDGDSISRMYYFLKCMREAFREMEKVSTKKD